MAPRKLSDSDKGTIVDLYKQPGQTTTTLAEQYGVSNSTISRILKMNIPADEYRALVSQKRTGGGADRNSVSKGGAPSKASSSKASGKGRTQRSRKATSKKAAINQGTDNQDADNQGASSQSSDNDIVADSKAASDLGAETLDRTSIAPPKLKTAAEKKEARTQSSTRRRRRRSAAESEDEQLPLLATDEALKEELPLKAAPDQSPITALADEETDDDDDDDDDDLTGLDETLGDDFGDDDDDLDDDDDDIDEDDDESTAPKTKLQVKTAMEIMPLGEAVLPKPCYLVVDMRAELITRPLVEFADIGQVPSEEERAKTLPVFDNHRVARRFSRNKQRVIKVPDGSLITRTSPYLAAKGITRLFVDGQVFDLANAGANE